MKFILDQLKVGDLIKGLVQEVISQQELIISFNGDLIRASNKTHLGFKEGDQAHLKVVAVEPLVFQLSRPHRKGLDVNI